MKKNCAARVSKRLIDETAAQQSRAVLTGLPCSDFEEWKGSSDARIH